MIRKIIRKMIRKIIRKIIGKMIRKMVTSSSTSASLESASPRRAITRNGILKSNKFFLIKKLPSNTPSGFDLTIHSSADGDDTTRPRRQGTNQVFLLRGVWWCILLGSMLWSQFSAIFANLRRKQLAFFSKTNVMITLFAKTSSCLSKKRQYFR
jgi:hypothetical protein